MTPNSACRKNLLPRLALSVLLEVRIRRDEGAGEAAS